MPAPPRIGVVVSSVNGISATHSTVHLIRSALATGFAVELIEPWDFEVDERGRPGARAHRLEPEAVDLDTLAERLRTHLSPRRHTLLGGMRALLLRASPLNATILTFAQLAEAAGVPVRNQPGELLRTAHKSWLATLSGVPRPRTLITRAPSAIARFVSTCPAVILKPARASGGRGVSLVRGQTGLNEAIDTAMQAGDGYIVAQEYLRGAEAGERRLLFLRGHGIIGGYLRMRSGGEFRHNLRLGADPVACPPDPRDALIGAALAPHLASAGVWFAGVDVIDGHVIEVNTLNPGGIHWTSTFSGRDVGAEVLAGLLAAAQPC